MKARKKLPEQASEKAKDAVDDAGQPDGRGGGPPDDVEPEVVIDRSDDDAREALREMGEVDVANASREELAERVQHLEAILDVHEDQ